MRNTIYIFASLFLFLSVSVAFGQTYLSESWVGEGGQTAVFSKNIVKTDDLDNVYVAGATLNGNGMGDIIVQKFTKKGVLIWQQVFNGAANKNDMAADLYIDEDYNVYVTGTAVKEVTGNYDLVVLKYSSTGSLVWDYYYDNGGVPLPDDGGTTIVGEEDELYIAGASMGDTTTQTDFIVIALDTAGNDLWQYRYDYAGLNDIPGKIRLREDYLDVIGATQTSTLEWDMAVVTFFRDGTYAGDSHSGGSATAGIDEVYDMTVDAYRNLYVTGAFVNIGTGYDIGVYKLDDELNMRWEAFFDGHGVEDKGKGIKVDSEGNVYVTGYVTHPGQGKNFVLVKYDSTGIEQWSREYNGMANTDDEAVQLVIDEDDRVFIVGEAKNTSFSDIQLAGYLPDGNLFCQISYKGPAGLQDKPVTMAIDSSGSILVAGQSKAVNNTFQNKTIKYTIQEKPVQIVSVNGYPSHNNKELLIRFDSSAIIYSAIDKRDFQAGNLMDFVKPAVLTSMQAKTGLDWSRFPAFKIFRRMTTADSLSVTRLGDTIRIDDFWATLSVYLPSDNNNAVIDSLETMYPLIRYAERNHVGMLHSVPNDPNYTQFQVVLHSPVYGINVEGAWDIQVGQSYTKVGVYDTGIDWAHEDFGDSTDSKITYAWDYYQNLPTMQETDPDWKGHGTQVTGVIGAQRNNGIGVAGVAGGDAAATNPNKGASLYCFTIYPPDYDEDYYEDTAKWYELMSVVSPGMVEGAVRTEDFGFGLHIQNHSWGSIYESNLLKESAETCYLNNCLLVVSSGNMDPDTVYYPASYNDAWLVRVGACSWNGNYWDESSIYQNTVDVVAGGAGAMVHTTEIFNDYVSVGGTSLAAPQVTGVAALMQSQHNVLNGYPNNLAPEDFEYFLEHFAKDIDTVGYDQGTGHGLVDAHKTLERISKPVFYVKHSGVGGTPIQTVTSGMAVTLTDTIDGLLPGQYFADRYQVTNTFTDIFPVNETVIDHWPRYSSSKGVSASSANITGNTFFNYTVNTNQNTTEVTSTTYCWYITETQTNIPVNKWIPASPQEIKSAYSLYVMNTDYVGIEENKKESTMMIYPNPSNSTITVKYLLEAPEDITFEIIDVSGKIVCSREIKEKTSGIISLDINISNLSQGFYICTLHVGENVISQRIIKN